MARFFFGIPIAESDFKGLSDRLLEKKWSLPKGRWTEPKNAHITICFLGNLEAHQTQILMNLDGTDLASLGFDILLNVFGAFPSMDQARILWAGSNQRIPNKLIELEQFLKSWAKEHQLPFDQKGLVPHVTLARFPKIWHANLQPTEWQFPGITIQAQDLVLYESLGHGQYSRVRSWSLGLQA